MWSLMCTYIVLTVVTPSKDTRVPEDSGDLEICLRKDKDTAREFSVAVFFTEVSTENAATGNVTVFNCWCKLCHRIRLSFCCHNEL